MCHFRDAVNMGHHWHNFTLEPPHRFAATVPVNTPASVAAVKGCSLVLSKAGLLASMVKKNHHNKHYLLADVSKLCYNCRIRFRDYIAEHK